MARKEKYTKKDLLKYGVKFVDKYGIDKLNARDLGKFIGCSTQPIFRHYKTLYDYKVDLRSEIHKHYEKFIEKYIDKENYLLTISYAYAIYAKKEPNLFQALFMTDLAKIRTIEEVLHSSWNRETIESTKETFHLTMEKAEALYRDVRFFTHGMACQLCAKSIKLTDQELYNLINNIIIKLR